MNWDKLQNIDIRILYVIILLCMMIPMFKPMGLPVAVSRSLRDRSINVIEDLPDGSVIWVSHDTGSGNAPELNPMITRSGKASFSQELQDYCHSVFQRNSRAYLDLQSY
jgi:hypothetical protein